MAIGDKLFVADKVTLDLVKADTTVLMNKSVNIDGLSHRPIKVSGPLNPYNTLITVAEITGSGYLSTAIVYNDYVTAERSAGIRITIDGTIILDVASTPLRIKEGSVVSGIGIAETLIGGGTDSNTNLGVGLIPSTPTRLSYLSIGNAVSEFPSSTTKTTTNNGCVYITKRPIKFNNSLKVEMLGSTSNVVGIVEYYIG